MRILLPIEFIFPRVSAAVHPYWQSMLDASKCVVDDSFCLCTGVPCEKEHSTCNGRNEMCIGRGPAWEADDHGFKSNEIIARRQSDKAQALWEDGGLDISGKAPTLPFFYP